jgi:hypothetical protein
LNTWILPNNERVVLCIKRVKDYNFATKYLLTPKCKREDEEICGGRQIYYENHNIKKRSGS